MKLYTENRSLLMLKSHNDFVFAGGGDLQFGRKLPRRYGPGMIQSDRKCVRQAAKQARIRPHFCTKRYVVVWITTGRIADCGFFPYRRRAYRSFRPVHCDEIEYSLKYADRALLDELFARRGNCGEIMIIKQGRVTDCSIGNLIFRRDRNWFTPDRPLLNGTQRQYLLAAGKIREAVIWAEDIGRFDEIRLINAMNGL